MQISYAVNILSTTLLLFLRCSVRVMMNLRVNVKMKFKGVTQGPEAEGQGGVEGRFDDDGENEDCTLNFKPFSPSVSV